MRSREVVHFVHECWFVSLTKDGSLRSRNWFASLTNDGFAALTKGGSLRSRMLVRFAHVSTACEPFFAQPYRQATIRSFATIVRALAPLFVSPTGEPLFVALLPLFVPLAPFLLLEFSDELDG